MATESKIFGLRVVLVCFLQSTVVICADTDYMANSIRNYLADTRHHDANPAYKTRAKEFIFSEFEKFGLATEYHDFEYYNGQTFTNVIGVKKGDHFGKSSDRTLGILAHYDTVRTTKGVDDNGAGVAAILEVARQLHENNVNTEHTVIFVSPDLEEDGLVGTYYFVNSWLPEWAANNYPNATETGDNAQGCIVLDTMMEYNTSKYSQLVPDEAAAMFQQVFPDTLRSVESDEYEGDFLNLIYRKTEDSAIADTFKQSWKDEGREQYEIEPFALPFSDISMVNGIEGFSNFLRSDHRVFWETGIPAIFLTDSANFRGDMIHCYHAPCDNLEVMLTDDNIQFLGKTADALVRTVKNMAGASETSGSGTKSHSAVLAVVLIVLGLLIFA